MKLYRTPEAVIAVRGEDAFVLADFSMDALFDSNEPEILLEDALRMAHPVDVPGDGEGFLPPVGKRQEVWGAEGAGADGERPVLFFKAAPPAVRGHSKEIRLRKDSARCVPQAALTLAVNAAGKVFGFTIGNDVTARDLLEENPLYLPQAKFFRGACALGPCLVLTDDFQNSGAVRLSVERGGAEVFSGGAELARTAGGFENLTGWLSRTGNFTHGCLLMTNAGIVTPPDFALEPGDVVVRIMVDGIGELVNPVA